MVREKTAEILLSVLKSGELVHVPVMCTGCSICELMWSLYHEGVQGSSTAQRTP